MKNGKWYQIKFTKIMMSKNVWNLFNLKYNKTGPKKNMIKFCLMPQIMYAMLISIT